MIPDATSLADYNENKAEPEPILVPEAAVAFSSAIES
jgi:hypothetical protein